MKISINGNNPTIFNNEDLIDRIHDELSDFIEENIDLRTQYKDIDFEYCNPMSASSYVSSYEDEIKTIHIEISSLETTGGEIVANFTAYIEFLLDYNIAIDAYDWADGDHFSLGEIEKTFEEELEINGVFELNLDQDAFNCNIDPITYPEIDTYVEPVSELYDETEWHDESKYLMNFIQDKTFTSIPILDKQLSLAQKLLIEVSNSHELNSMIHANIITSLEHYLSKKLIPLIVDNEQIQKAYCNQMTDKMLKIFSICDIVNEQITPSKVIIKHLTGKSFHHVDFIKSLLLKVFKVDLTKETNEWLNDAIAIRHDCVHRSGYDSEHQPVPISKESNEMLIIQVKDLVSRLETELPIQIEKIFGTKK